MRIGLDVLPKLFETLVQETIIKGGPVMTLVAHDADAICACRILKALLDSKGLHISITPVNGMEALTQVFTTMIQGNKTIRTVVLLNCGGNVDLFEEFQLDQLTNLQLYVCDSRRPFHPANIANQQQIYLFDDTATIEDLQLQLDVETQDIAMGDGDDSDLDISDEEDEFQGLSLEEAARKRRIKAFELQAESHFAFTAAGVMFSLASKIGHSKNELLWYAIVGLTDQFIHQKINLARYNSLYQFFVESVENLTVHSTTHLDSHKIIVLPKEYRFMLYRHWNLYDSMSHTRYLVERLQLWTTRGQRLLDTWLAQMGLPLKECQEPWRAMRPDLKKILAETLRNSIELKLIQTNHVSINNLFFPSFAKKPHFDREISASDAVYAIDALLESTKRRQTQADPNEVMDPSKQKQDALRENFWNAFSCLANANFELLKQGFQEAIEHQQAIVRQVKAMMQKSEIGKASFYRYANLKEGADTQAFNHPLTLTQLGHFVVDILIESGKARQVKPFIITVPRIEDRPTSERTQFASYLVVGLPGFHSGSPNATNSFGKHFALAAKRSNAQLTYTSFDSFVVEVPKEDLHKFSENLQIVLYQPDGKRLY